MSRVKVLSLSWWMVKFNDKRLFANMPKLNETETVFNRDGYYLMGSKCWFEADGRAWLYKRAYFKEDLEVLNMPMYRESEYKAFEVMKQAGLLSKQLQSNLFWFKYKNCKRKRREKAKTYKRLCKLKEKIERGKNERK